MFKIIGGSQLISFFCFFLFLFFFWGGGGGGGGGGDKYISGHQVHVTKSASDSLLDKLQRKSNYALSFYIKLVFS